jgi:hypothetical protein
MDVHFVAKKAPLSPFRNLIMGLPVPNTIYVGRGERQYLGPGYTRLFYD